MRNARLSVLLLVVLSLLVGLVGPADAASASGSRAKRDQARARKADLAKELDALQASEDQLVGAIATLDDEVSAQSAKVDATRQAAASAEAELAEAERAVAGTKARIATLTDVLVNRAVESFMRPEEPMIEEFIRSQSIAEAARKQAFLGQVAANDADVIDQYNAARQDFEVQQRAAEDARTVADERRVAAEGELVRLETARDAKAQLRAELESRQKAVLAEIEAQAQSEAELTRIIRESEALVTGAPDLRAGGGGCIWPTRGVVTSGFGPRGGRLHAGIDIGAPNGTPIWAAKAGTVIFAGVQSGYGNVVVLNNGGGLSTLYAHQSRLAARGGQAVSQGDVIGYVGSSGHSTGPHVHFETRYGGSPRNPRSCLS